MRGHLVIIGLGCTALLAGCALLRETQEPAPWVQSGMLQPASNADSLLLYFQHIRNLSSAELGKEYETARQAYAQSRSDFNRVRFAMVLALPGSANGDEGRALELLEPVSKNPNSRLSGLANLLISHLQERKRLDLTAQGLQQKLDALRSLERSLIERRK